MNRILFDSDDDENNMQYNLNYSDRNNQHIDNNSVSKRKTKRTNSYAQKVATKKIIKIYAIILIIVGIVLIGKSTFAIVMGTQKSIEVPQVSVEKMGKEIEINVVATFPMKEIRYNWNGDSDIVIQGEEKEQKTIRIEIPNGNNILNLAVVDQDGNKSYFKKQYIYESNDTGKPQINIQAIAGKLVITAVDDTKISYMTYRWNDETENEITESDDAKTITVTIDVEPGENKLTIIAVDAEGNQQSRTEKIVGDMKPEVFIEAQDGKLQINAKDDQGISKISVSIDGTTTDTGDTPLNQKEVSATMDIENGDHTIQVVVVNVNGLENIKELSASY